ncbi:hypothetical protein BH09ACT9_BH09ACT9_00290 [soil metagenome]
MARIRTIKPGFFRSYDVSKLSYRARLTWIGLWTYVDDEGRGRYDARIIKGELWALEDDVTWQDVEADLMELSRSAHIQLYESSGRQYLAIPTWLEHQVISRPSKSKFPDPADCEIRVITGQEGTLTEDSLSTHGALPAGSGTGNREEEREMEEEREPSPPAKVNLDAMFDQAYASWPKKTEREPSKAKFKSLCVKHDPAWLQSKIIEFGQAYAATTQKNFVPALVVWLNRSRWTDELPTAQSGEHKKPTSEERARETLNVPFDPEDEIRGINR